MNEREFKREREKLSQTEIGRDRQTETDRENGSVG